MAIYSYGRQTSDQLSLLLSRYLDSGFVSIHPTASPHVQEESGALPFLNAVLHHSKVRIRRPCATLQNWSVHTHCHRRKKKSLGMEIRRGMPRVVVLIAPHRSHHVFGNKV